jgi:hypothetical protein
LKDPEPNPDPSPDPYIKKIMTGTDPGGPKTYGPGSGSTTDENTDPEKVIKNKDDALLAADQISKLQAICNCYFKCF